MVPRNFICNLNLAFSESSGLQTQRTVSCWKLSLPRIISRPLLAKHICLTSISTCTTSTRTRPDPGSMYAQFPGLSTKGWCGSFTVPSLYLPSMIASTGTCGHVNPSPMAPRLLLPKDFLAHRTRSKATRLVPVRWFCTTSLQGSADGSRSCGRGCERWPRWRRGSRC